MTAPVPRPAEEPDREALSDHLGYGCEHERGMCYAPTPPAPGGTCTCGGAHCPEPAPGGCEDPGCPLVEDHVHAPPPMSFDLPGGLRPFTAAEEAAEAASGPWDPPAPGGGDTDLRGEVCDVLVSLDNYWRNDPDVTDLIADRIVAALVARDADQGAGALAEVADVLRKYHAGNPDLPRWLAALGATS